MNNDFMWKLSMYWGSKWKTYFGLFYAASFQAAHAALEQYSFPITKKRRAGWAIEYLPTKEVYFSYEEYLGKADDVDESREVSDGEEPLEQPESDVGLGVLFIHREKSRLLQPRPKRLG